MTDSNTTPDKADVLKKAYRKATSRLREEERDRFEVLMQEEAAKEGVEYIPSRVLREAKAREEIARLAAQHGIPVSFKVETTEDAQRNADILQANAAVRPDVPWMEPVATEPFHPDGDRAARGDEPESRTLYQHLREAAVAGEERAAAEREGEQE